MRSRASGLPRAQGIARPSPRGFGAGLCGHSHVPFPHPSGPRMSEPHASGPHASEAGAPGGREKRARRPGRDERA
jgi:hypothetical protein